MHSKQNNYRPLTTSPEYQDGKFNNLVDTPMMLKGTPILKILYRAINKPKNSKPPVPLPSQVNDLREVQADKPVITWFGHSSYLIQSKGINILVDPVFSDHAAPVSFVNLAFKGSNAYDAADMPSIDVLVSTHDHYDHFDTPSIVALKDKTRSFVVPLGMGPNVGGCSIRNVPVFELDWWEEQEPVPGVSLTAVPARHFSGRGLKRNPSLWTAYVLKLHGFTILLGGDSGYESHFSEIGRKFGPFDIVMLECGQYNEYWPDIHMMPEQTYQAAKDLNASFVLPVHWAKFALSDHRWDEPVDRIIAASQPGGPRVVTPMIGEPVVLGERYPDNKWWRQLGIILIFLISIVSSLRTQAQTDTVLLKQYFAANKEQVDLKKPKDIKLFDDSFYDHSVFLFGESHGSADPLLLDPVLFKQLHKKAGVRFYIAEVDDTKAWMLNSYMRDGNEDWLRKVFGSWVADTTQWGSRNNYERYKALHKFFQSLPAKDQFTIIGVDIAQDYTLLKTHLGYLLSLQPPVSRQYPWLDSLKLVLDTVTYAGRLSLGEFARRLLDELQANGRALGTTGKNNRQVRRLVTSLSFIEPGVSRDSVMYRNFRDVVIEEGLQDQKFYGFLGFFHCLMTSYNNQETFASLLSSGEETPFANKVTSIEMMALDSKMMIPLVAQLRSMMPSFMIEKSMKENPGYGNGRYMAYDMSYDSQMMLVKDLKILRSLTKPKSVTLLKLDAPGSPFGTSKLFGEISGFQRIRITDRARVTTDAFQYILFFRNSAAAVPLELP